MPIRTCVACRNRIAKERLQRYVWDKTTETVVPDDAQVMAGRGAYCCRDETCEKRFFSRKKGWKQIFRIPR